MPTALHGVRLGIHRITRTAGTPRGTMIHGTMAAGTVRTGITAGTIPGTMIITGIVRTITAAGIGIPGTTTPGIIAAGTGLIITTMAIMATTTAGTTITMAPAAERVSLRPIPGQWHWVAIGKAHSLPVEEHRAAHRTAAAL